MPVKKCLKFVSAVICRSIFKKKNIATGQRTQDLSLLDTHSVMLEKSDNPCAILKPPWSKSDDDDDDDEDDDDDIATHSRMSQVFNENKPKVLIELLI